MAKKKKVFPAITLFGIILIMFGAYTYFNASLFVSWFGSIVGAIPYSDITKDEIRNNLYVPKYGSAICEAWALGSVPMTIHAANTNHGPGLRWKSLTKFISKVDQVKYEDFVVTCYGAYTPKRVWGAKVKVYKNDYLVEEKFINLVDNDHEFCNVVPFCTPANRDFRLTIRIPVSLMSDDKLKIEFVCYQANAFPGTSKLNLLNTPPEKLEGVETLDGEILATATGMVTKAWVFYNSEGVKIGTSFDLAGCPTSTIRQVVPLSKQPRPGEERELPKKDSVLGVLTGFFRAVRKDFYDPDKYERITYAPVGDGFLFVEDWEKIQAPELVVLNYNGQAVIGRRTPLRNELWAINKIETTGGRVYYIPSEYIGSVECLDNSDCKGNFYCSERFRCEAVEGRCITDFDCTHGRGTRQYVWNGESWDLVDYSGTCQNGVCKPPKVIATNLKCNPTMPNACPLGYHCDPERGCVPDNVKLFCKAMECCFGNNYLNPHDCPEGYKCERAYDSDRGICIKEDEKVDEFCDMDGEIDPGENCENCAHDIEAVKGFGYCQKPKPKGKYEFLGLTIAAVGMIIFIMGIWREF